VFRCERVRAKPIGAIFCAIKFFGKLNKLVARCRSALRGR